MQNEQEKHPFLVSPEDNGAHSATGLSIFPKPRTPDPFVNSSLTSVGPNADGVERFWISCVNSFSLNTKE